MSGTEVSGMAVVGGRRDGITTATIVLGAFTGLGFVAAGIAGWLTDATDGDGGSLFWWLLLLLGGGAIVLAGVAILRTRPRLAVAAFAIGGLAGSLMLFWSVIAEVLVVALVVLAVMHARRATD